MRASEVAIGDQVRVVRGTPLRDRQAGNRTLGVIRNVWRPDRRCLVELDDGARVAVDIKRLRREERS